VLYVLCTLVRGTVAHFVLSECGVCDVAAESSSVPSCRLALLVLRVLGTVCLCVCCMCLDCLLGLYYPVSL
jgi:hypothetical protein